MLLVLGEQAAFEIAHAIEITALAATEQELDEAADHLARAIAIGGVAAVGAALARLSRGKIGRGGPPEETLTEEPRVGPQRRTPSSGGDSESGRGGGKGGGGGPALILGGVSAEEIEWAAAPNKTLEPELKAQISARKAVAEAFYRKYCKHYSDAQIKQEVNGIDLTKPVKPRLSPPPPPPETTIQWQPKGMKGNYFGNPGSLPKEMGVGEFGLEPGPVPRKIVMKEESHWKITPGTPLLESTASKVNDTWSVKPGQGGGSPFTAGDIIGEKGMIQKAKGGAIQYFVPDKSRAVQVPSE